MALAGAELLVGGYFGKDFQMPNLDIARSTARSLHSAASTLRKNADTIPGGKKMTRFANTAAGKLDSAASYVRDHELQDMMNDVSRVVRRRPTQSLLVAAIAGFVAGRLVRRG